MQKRAHRGVISTHHAGFLHRILGENPRAAYRTFDACEQTCGLDRTRVACTRLWTLNAHSSTAESCNTERKLSQLLLAMANREFIETIRRRASKEKQKLVYIDEIACTDRGRATLSQCNCHTLTWDCFSLSSFSFFFFFSLAPLYNAFPW